MKRFCGLSLGLSSSTSNISFIDSFGHFFFSFWWRLCSKDDAQLILYPVCLFLTHLGILFCRVAFDEDCVPELMESTYLQDIHSISSLLKMYFRELPNPLLTYQLYDKFAVSIPLLAVIRIHSYKNSCLYKLQFLKFIVS